MHQRASHVYANTHTRALLSASRYGNNCDCSDHCRTPAECEMQIAGDVKAMTGYDFDSWKLDGW